MPQKDICTYLINNKERNKLRKDIISERLKEGSFSRIDKNGNDLYNGNVKNEKRLDVVIGLPAAGKSSAIVNTLSEFYQSAIIDSDIIKSRLPEFSDGWGAMLVHEESSIMNVDLLNETLKTGANLVLPIVGSKVSSVEKYIALAKEYGYAINLHLNELPNGKAIGRMLMRYFEKGRFIDPSFAIEYGDKPTKVYKEVKQRIVISGYSWLNNDVERGKRPKLNEISKNNELYGIYNESSGQSGRKSIGRANSATPQQEKQGKRVETSSISDRNTRASITAEDKISTFKEVSSYRAEGKTLSDSALEAYQNGEMPKSVWSRKDFVFAVHEVNLKLDITEVNLSGLRELFLEKTGVREICTTVLYSKGIMSLLPLV